jgi:hypothetical protein
MSNLSAQMIGQLGELVEQKELVERGWLVGNFNNNAQNAAAYDLFAAKGKRRVCLRVKATSGDSVQYNAKKDGRIFSTREQDDDGDFVVIVLVRLTKSYEFHVLPTGVVEDALIETNLAWHGRPKRDGTPRKKGSHRALFFGGPLSESTPLHRAMRHRWREFRDAWHQLEPSPMHS